MMASMSDPVISHLVRLTDGTGIFEHACGLIPKRSNGYTTDDVARALIVAVRWPDPTIRPLGPMIDVYLAFLHDAITLTGSIRNRLTFDRQWQSSISADAHGRAIWGLAVAATEGRERHVRAASLAALARLAPPRDVSLRPGVYAALGAANLLGSRPDNVLANRIVEQVARSLPAISDDTDWLWPEKRLTYDNARIPECYLALGEVTGNDRLRRDGLKLLEWLASIERHGEHFSFTPVGGRGPMDRSPRFDQQPLEATAMVDACLRAWRITGEYRWFERATAAVAWFAGLNDSSTAVYDPETGAGFDGLTAAGINSNAGAESTISGLWALGQAVAFGLAQSGDSRRTCLGRGTSDGQVVSDVPGGSAPAPLDKGRLIRRSN